MKVILIGKPSFIVDDFLAFLESHQLDWKRSQEAGDAEELVELAGRICYLSFGKKQSKRSNKEYINNLIKMGHESVLEHVSWTFLVSGISRALTHQLVRHRVGFSFSQLSQQYHDETDAEFIEPSFLKQHPEIRQVWENAIKSSQYAYNEILHKLNNHENGNDEPRIEKEFKRAVRSTARSILPNATETKIVITANARALRHFLNIRGSIVGDHEMRSLSTNFLRCLQNEAPALFSDFQIKTMDDGSPIVVKEES